MWIYSKNLVCHLGGGRLVRSGVWGEQVRPQAGGEGKASAAWPLVTGSSVVCGGKGCPAPCACGQGGEGEQGIASVKCICRKQFWKLASGFA